MKKWNGTEAREESKKAEKDKVCEKWEECQESQQGFILHIKYL